MMRVELIIVAGVLFAASASALGAATERPDADALLLAALSAPTSGYVARGRIQSFSPGRKPKALGMIVYCLPNGRLRREVRTRPRFAPEQIYVGDGSQRSLYWPKLGTLWGAVMADEPAAEAAARLRSLYEVSVATGGRVAKHETWRLDLRAPDGRLRRALWVDRASGLVLKSEDYRLDGALLRRERLTALAEENPDPGFFRLEPPPGTRAARMTAPRGPNDPDAVFPLWIPDGFLALASSVEGAGLSRTLAIGYGDGMRTFTLREAPGGADFGPGGTTSRSVRLHGGARAALVFGADGPLLEFRFRGRAYSITGEIAEDQMIRVADSIAAASP